MAIPGSLKDLILRTGFGRITFEGRTAAMSKGRLLVEKGHVVHVEQNSFPGFYPFVSGYVIRQTNVNNPPYGITLELDEQRRVLHTTCECASGKGGECKHICDLVLYCNSETGASKTAAPQEWRKPSVRQAVGRERKVRKRSSNVRLVYVYPEKNS